LKNPNNIGYQVDLVARLYKTYELSTKDPFSVLRPHLGASLIGEKCSRKLWYTFRWAGITSHHGRMLRLFQTGHLEEQRFIDELRKAGVSIWDRDPRNRYSQYAVSFFGGHFSGSMDGCGVNFPGLVKEWHVAEFKTHSEKSFEKLNELGVKFSKYMHYVQMQIYMLGSGMRWAMYIAKNKNTDELYAERVAYDPAIAEFHKEKAKSVIFDSGIPARINSDIESYDCRYCEFKAICHEGDAVLETCRSCFWSSPKEDGQWYCIMPDNVKNKADGLSKQEQFDGCEQWKPMRGLYHG
jgi:hypothetical protein